MPDEWRLIRRHILWPSSLCPRFAPTRVRVLYCRLPNRALDC
jgi:hypothetical protein